MIKIFIVGKPSKKKMMILENLNKILPDEELQIFSSDDDNDKVDISTKNLYWEYNGNDPQWNINRMKLENLVIRES